MKISFDCLKCLKHLQLEEHIYKEAYEGHELCLSCRPVEDETPMSNTIDKQLLSEKELQDMRMIAFNSYDDFSKYAAAKILQMYDHIEGLKIALQTHQSYDKTVGEYHDENVRLREALEQIVTEPTTKYRLGDHHYWRTNARNIARKALNTLVTEPKTSISTYLELLHLISLEADYEKDHAAAISRIKRLIDEHTGISSASEPSVDRVRYLTGDVVKCSGCNGRGYTGSENHPECPMCSGNGYVKEETKDD